MALGLADEVRRAGEDLIQREMARPGASSDACAAGWSKEVWAAAAAAGWSDVLLGEEHGGLGLGLEATAELFSLIGRHLVPGPYPDLVVTVPLVYRHASAAVRARLDKARAGGEVIVLADPAAGTGDAAGTVELRDRSLAGTVSLVRHADIAGAFLVVARDQAGDPALAFVDASDPRVVVRPRDSFDSSSPVADVTFGPMEIPDDHLLPVPGGVTAGDLVERLRACLRLMVAAELAGLARHLLEVSVRYAGLREQFGRPIGSFQAVQEILVEMAVQLLGAEALTAECAVGTEPDPADAVTAKGLASEVARQVGESALQVHGGIAFTREFKDNRWFLRILTLQGMYGDQATSYRAVGRALLSQEATSVTTTRS